MYAGINNDIRVDQFVLELEDWSTKGGPSVCKRRVVESNSDMVVRKMLTAKRTGRDVESKMLYL